MTTYKGFDKYLKCRGFQFEVGKEYEEQEAKVCERGFHACENPLDVFRYYAPSNSRYCEVDQSGTLEKHYEDSKIASTKIKINAEIDLKSIIEAGVKFILEKVNWKDDKIANTGNYSAATNTGDDSAATNTGYQSAATNTGNYSAATNTGDHSAATNTGDESAATNTGDESAATNTGYRSAATVEGKESVAISLGTNGRAKGAKGCFIVLAEWKQDSDYHWHRETVKSVKVDGEKIKENVFYVLKNGIFTELE